MRVHFHNNTPHLHLAVGLAEGLLLRRQRLDGVTELLRCWNGLQHEWDGELVLVLDDERVLGPEHLGAVEAAHLAGRHSSSGDTAMIDWSP